MNGPGAAGPSKLVQKRTWRTPLSPKGVLYATLTANLLAALTKAGAVAWTGSLAMTSEAVHSAVDTLNEVLLLYGIRRSDRRADVVHPLGYRIPRVKLSTASSSRISTASKSSSSGPEGRLSPGRLFRSRWRKATGARGRLVRWGNIPSVQAE
jgi:hypothetical protein